MIKMQQILQWTLSPNPIDLFTKQKQNKQTKIYFSSKCSHLNGKINIEAAKDEHFKKLYSFGKTFHGTRWDESFPDSL